MEHIADFFKKSGHEENDFPVDEAAWSRLEVALDQKKRKRWIPFWWGSMGLALLIGVTIYYLSRPASYPSIPEQQAAAVSKETPATSTAQATSKTPKATIKEASATNLKEIVAADKIRKEAAVPGNGAEVDEVAVSSAQNQERVETSARVEQATYESSPSIPENPVEQEPDLPVLVKAASTPAEKIEQKAWLKNKIVGPVSSRQKDATRYNSSESKVVRAPTGGQSIGTKQQQSGIFGANILGEEINTWQKEGRHGRWQLSAGIADIPGRYMGVLNYLTTDIQNANNPNAMPYTLADGSTVDLYYVDGVNNKVSDNLTFYRLSLFGNLGKGLSVKGSLLLGAINNKTPNALIRQVPDRPDIVYFTYSYRSLNWMGEIGLQYTFYRRQRFQPYIGLNVFQLLASSYNSERRIVAPGLNINERSNFTAGTGVISSLPGYYIEFGGQYLVTPKWSVGPSLIYAGAPLTQPQIGFGLEIRYRW